MNSAPVGHRITVFLGPGADFGSIGVLPGYAGAVGRGGTAGGGAKGGERIAQLPGVFSIEVGFVGRTVEGEPECFGGLGSVEVVGQKGLPLVYLTPDL